MACHGGVLMDINVHSISSIVPLFDEPAGMEYHPNVGHNKIDASGVTISTYPDFVVICIGTKDCDGYSLGAIRGDEGRVAITGPVSMLSELKLCRGGKSRTTNTRPKKHRSAFGFEHFHDTYRTHQAGEVKHHSQVSHQVMKVTGQL